MMGATPLAQGVTAVLITICMSCAVCEGDAGASRPPPLKDFVGICGHYHFDAPAYAPLAGLVRNYHPTNWDLDVRKPYKEPPYPFALNRVNWEMLYGDWRRAGFEVDASLMFDPFKPDDWVDPEGQAYAYGKAFARFFGPSGKNLVSVAELGNEPGSYSDAQFTKVARALARGLKDGDPRMLVATANCTPGESDRYAKSLACYEGWMDLIDVLNVHVYAIKGSWPNRVRTYPEDPECDFLSRVRELVAWRDEHAPGKQVWVTEFGWDAHLPGGAPLQQGVPIDRRPSTISRVQQAQYLVRGYLLFAASGVDRAYMFWYRDEGPSKGLHNADGLISAGLKQPAFFALRSLRRTLGDYRFSLVLAEGPGSAYACLFRAPGGRACVAFWNGTRGGEPVEYALDLEKAGLGNARLTRAVELTLEDTPEPSVEATVTGGVLKVRAVGTPRLAFFSVAPEQG